MNFACTILSLEESTFKINDAFGPISAMTSTYVCTWGSNEASTYATYNIQQVILYLYAFKS